MDVPNFWSGDFCRRLLALHFEDRAVIKKYLSSILDLGVCLTRRAIKSKGAGNA